MLEELYVGKNEDANENLLILKFKHNYHILNLSLSKARMIKGTLMQISKSLKIFQNMFVFI